MDGTDTPSSFPMSERTRGDVQLHWVAAKEAFMVQ